MTFSVKQIDKGGYYMKGFKKLTAGLMGVVMALGVCGFTALAEEPKKVTKDNFQDIVESAGNGDTITLTENIELEKALEIPNGKNITLDLDGNTLTGPDSGYAIQFGDSNTEEKNSGELEIINGKIESKYAIINYGGSIVLGKGLEVFSIYGAVASRGGEITVDGAYLYAKGIYIEDDSDKNDAGYTVTLFNIGMDNKKDSASLLMKKGKIEVGYGIALSGNNTKSAGTKVDIQGGTIEGLIGIYWPMEGELNITGGTIKGGTGIEAKMGTITISRDAEIIGTGAHSETEPVNGGSSPEGSAILISAQMYGASTSVSQYRDNKDLTLIIEGGTFRSNKGNAITVYNTEKQTGKDAQNANIVIESGDISGENSDIKYIGKSETEATTSVDGNLYETTKSKTTLKVAGDAAPAAVSSAGNTVFYKDVNDAVKAANNAGTETEVAVYGDSVLYTDVELGENVKLVVAPDTELKANISADGDKVIVAEKDENGNTVYKVVEEVENPAKNYEAMITSGGNTSYFKTLSEAVKTVQNGQTIKLLKDCGEAEVTRDVSFYVDDNDFDYKIGAGDGYVNTGRGDEYDFITEEDYEDERDSHRHSYSLKEGKTERDDEEEEPVVTPEPEPEEEEGPFSDVGKDNPNYDAIVEVYEKGWMAGIGDGVFAPNGTLTRGMAVTILWNRAGQPEPANVAPFLDVTSDAWYAKAVAWAYENGITSGYGDTYGPDDFLTTEQFTRMNDIANGRTPEVYVGGAPYATRGWVAGLLVME